MSIYLAKVTSKAAPPTTAFTTRNISGYTQAKPSELNIFAKPLSDQLAYAGYVQSLEAFLYATQTERKVFCSAPEYPLDSDYLPSVPIPLPLIVMRLNKTTLNGVQQAAINTIMEKIQGEKKEMKGAPVYTISKVSFKALRVGLPPKSSPNTPFIDGHCSPQAGYHTARIIQCIDLFLRTQTYEYKGEGKETEFNKRKEMMTTQGLYKAGTIGEKKNVKRIRVNEEGKWLYKESEGFSSEEVPDLKGEDRRTKIIMDGAVLSAKPSPHKSSYNYGSPSDVPNKPGLFFPYFDGLMVPDTAFIRDVVSSLFFRNLGSEGVSCQDAWKAFRTDIATLSQTTSGGIITHILAGCRLALQGQARLFLVFDVETYKGFCLLGDQFNIHIGRSCIVPVSADLLKDELSKVVTKSASAQALSELLDKYLALGEECHVDNLISSSSYLADKLDQVANSGEIPTEEMKEMSLALSRLHFQKKFLSISPTNILQALACVATETVDDSVPFYIPLTGWKGISTPTYKALARFGPNSISFYNAKGTGIAIPTSISKENGVVFSPIDVKGRVLVYEKPIKVCVTEMERVIRAGQIWQDEGERAAGQRANVFYDGERVTVAKALLELRHSSIFDTQKEKAVKESNSTPDFKPTDTFDINDF